MQHDTMTEATMAERFGTWQEAHTAALAKARTLNMEVGIRRAVEYGKVGFNVQLLPRADRRFGHDLACEVVRPTDPASA